MSYPSPAPSGSAPGSGSSPQTASHCSDCGSRLSGGACPACALGFLLEPPSTPGAQADEVEFGRYTLKRKLATGGMGVVYEAEDQKLKRTVALKMIRGSTFADDDEVARFTLEAEAAAALDHPHIVPIYEVGRLDGQPFYTMKLIEGQSLAKRLRENSGCLPAKEVASLLSRIARAVHHAHQRGVLHRDLKPGNILVDADGHPWLTDFGLAKVANGDSQLTMTKDHLGTPHYMAPEVAGGNARMVSTASDVWALGVMLWEMLCGVPPFHGPGPVEIMRRIVESEPVWPPGSRGDGDLVTIARRCMEKNPARRPQSAAEVADELDRWQRGEPIRARRVTRHERLLKWVRREPALAALYAVMAIALWVGLYLWRVAEIAVSGLTVTNDRIGESLRTATATKLAGDALLQVKHDPNRALLLAVEAVRMPQSSGILPEAASALMNVLGTAGGWDASLPSLAPVRISEVMFDLGQHMRRVALISPDGRWLLSTAVLHWGAKPMMAAIYDLHAQGGAPPVLVWEMWGPCRKLNHSFQEWTPDSRGIIVLDGEGNILRQKLVPDTLPPEGTQWPEPEITTLGKVAAGEDCELVVSNVVPDAGGATVLWLEKSKEPPAGQSQKPSAGKKENPKRLRMGRMRVTPAGVADVRHCNLDDLAESGAWLAMHPLGSGGLLFSPRGRYTPIYVDLAGEKPFRYPVDVPVDGVWTAEINAAGTHLAVALTNGSICVGRLPSGGGRVPLRAVMDYPALVWRVTVSPDGQWVAVAGESSMVKLRRLDEQSPANRELFLDGDAGTALQFSPDGRWLGAGGLGRTIHMWPLNEVLEGAKPVLLHGLATSTCEIVFSRDGNSVAAVGMGNCIRRWSFDGVSGAAMPGHLRVAPGVIHSSASPDGAWALSASDASVQGNSVVSPEGTRKGSFILSGIKKRCRLLLDTFGTGATGTAFSPDGKWIAGTGRDATVKVWDFAEAARCAEDGSAAPEPRFVFKLGLMRTEYYWSLTIHRDGRLFLVNGDGDLVCWDLQSRNPAETRKKAVIHSIKYLLPDLAISPDGRQLAVARHGWDAPRPGSDQTGSQILLFDISDRTEWPPRYQTFLQADFLELTRVAYSPDGRWLACGGGGHPPCLWDLHAADIPGSRIRPPVKAHLMAGVSFSPDNQWLALGSSEGRIYFWNWRRDELRSVQTGSSITCTTWLPDGHLLASGKSDQLTYWDTDLERLLKLARDVAGRELLSEERALFRVP